MSTLNSIKCPIQILTRNFFCSHTHATAPLHERRLWAAGRLFSCKCTACQKDYPLLEDLKHRKIDIEGILAGNGRELESYHRVCEVLQKYDSHYPCIELINGKKLMSFCFSYLVNRYKSLLRKHYYDIAQFTRIDVCAVFLRSISFG